MAKKRIQKHKKRAARNRNRKSTNKRSPVKTPRKIKKDISIQGVGKTFHIGKKSLSEVLRMVGGGKYGNDKAQIRRLMKGDRPNTITVLIDIQYKSALNAFEEFYGENISYQEIEQESYVEFKEIMFEKINRNIKFRKYGRIGPILTVKADMTNGEMDQFQLILDRNEIKMLHSWIVSNVTIITDKLLDDKGDNDGVDTEASDDELEENEDI